MLLTPTLCGRLRHPLAAAVRRAPLAGLPRRPFCHPSRSPTTLLDWRRRPCDGSPFWGCRLSPLRGRHPLRIASLFLSGFAAGVNRPSGRRRVGVPSPLRVGVSAISPCRPFGSVGRPVSSCGISFPFPVLVAFSGLVWLRLPAGLFLVFRPHYDGTQTQKAQAREPQSAQDPKKKCALSASRTQKKRQPCGNRSPITHKSMNNYAVGIAPRATTAYVEYS